MGPAWFLLYSKPATAKLRNIAARPRVSLHLDSDGQGSDIVMVLGDAALTDAPPAHEVPGYVESTPASSSPTRGRRRASPPITPCRCASRRPGCAASSAYQAPPPPPPNDPPPPPPPELLLDGDGNAPPRPDAKSELLNEGR